MIRNNSRCSLFIKIWYLHLTIIFITHFISSQITAAQVNTENLRKINLKNGFYGSLKLDYTLDSGNSNFSKIAAGFRSDFVSEKYYSFGVIQYQRGVQDKKDFINKGFIHLRLIRKFFPRFSGEFFLQKEFNQFIRLKDRNLVGAGIRNGVILPDSTRKYFNSFYTFIGIGIMWENEKIDLHPVKDTKIFRSTNYLSLRWVVNDHLDFNLVSY